GNNGLSFLFHCSLLSGFSTILSENKIIAFLSFSVISLLVISLTNSVRIFGGIISSVAFSASFNCSGFNHFLSSNSLLIYFITCFSKIRWYICLDVDVYNISSSSYSYKSSLLSSHAFFATL